MHAKSRVRDSEVRSLVRSSLRSSRTTVIESCVCSGYVPGGELG